MSFSLKPKKQINNNSTSITVDWDAYNAHIEEQINAALAESDDRDEGDPLVGIISGLVDLGLQQPDEVTYEYKEKDHAYLLEEGNAEKYNSEKWEDESGKEMITYTPLEAQQVAIFADFPEIQINYGKFFTEEGEDNFKPYRHLLNGEWFNKEAQCMLVNKPYNLKSVRPKGNNKVWTFAPNSMISKLAVAGKVEDLVLTEDLDVGGLLGIEVKFDVKVSRSDKGFLNVSVTNPQKKTKKDVDVEYTLEPFGVTFDDGADEEVLKQLRASIKNTMQRALNWDESKVKVQLEALNLLRSNSKDTDEGEDEPEKEAPKKKETPKKAPPAVNEYDFDDDLPF